MAPDNSEVANKLAKLRRAVEQSPTSPTAHLRLGTALMHASQWGEAETVLRRAVELDPDCAGAWVNLGGIHMARWEFAECVAANDKAIAAEPDLLMAHYNRGLGFLYLKKPEEMLACFERVLELEPKNAGAQYHMAIAQFDLGEVEAARARLAIALDLGYSPQPDFVKALERTAPEGVTMVEVGDPKPKKRKPN